MHAEPGQVTIACMRGQRMPAAWARGASAHAQPDAAVVAAIDRKAPVERTQLDETSWVDLWRGLATAPDPLFDALAAATRWRQTRTRLADGRWVDAPRLLGTLVDVDSFAAQVLRRAGLVLEARYRARFGAFGLMQYRDGDDSIGLHRDRELRFLEDTISAGMSLGGARPFCLRPRFGGEVRSFMLGAGDAYVMGGRCQSDWMHGVPKVAHAEPKVSVIWRWTSKRGRPEP